MTGDLDGVLVVSLEQAVAAPYCASRLADAGARVIKIERPEGDFARRYDRHVMGQSTYFVWLNRGKESLCLDLKDKDDIALLQRIIAKADVVIQNLVPGATERMGIASTSLRQANPRLITCDISGYGDAGPYRDMKAYDLLVQAETGLCSVTGNADGPSRVGVSVCDIACGMYAHAAILQALIGRQKTGKGRGIQVSLFSGMADWMNVVYLQRKYGGSVPPRLGLAHPTIAPYGVFHCRDGDLLLSIQNEREWKMLCEIALEGEVTFDDPLFHDVVARVANRTELERRMNSIFGREARAVIAERLKEASVAFGLLNDVDGLIAHPQLRTVTYATPEGEATVIAPAAAIVGETPTYRAVPATGQHSTALRKEFA